MFVKGTVCVNVVLGDITDMEVDAIVNPANTLLTMGGGVAGAIKRKGGEIIEREARKYAPVNIGEAVVTSAGRLKCKYVIHAPTVQYPGSPSSSTNVYKATHASLAKAREMHLKTIAFPLMGAGVGGLKPEESLESMLRAILELGEGIEVILVVRDEDTYGRVVNYLERSGWTKVQGAFHGEVV